MTFKGVHRLDDIKARCIVDPITECWNWNRAFMKCAKGAPQARVWYTPEQRTMQATRVALVLAGRQAGVTVWRTCKSWKCCNPAHLMTGTWAEHGAWQVRSGHLRGLPQRSLTAFRSKLKQRDVVLNMELAAWIRESDQTLEELAHVFDCDFSTISKVRLFKCWVPTAPNASVFSMRA